MDAFASQIRATVFVVHGNDALRQQMERKNEFILN